MWKKLLPVMFCIMAIFLITGTASATVYQCDTCDSCNTAIAGALPEDIIQVNQSLSSDVSGCLLDSAVNNITIDCNGYSLTSTAIAFGGINILSASNVTISNCGMLSGWDNGIFLNSDTDVIVENCTFYGNANGMYIFNGANNTIRNNNMTWNNIALIFEGSNHLVQNNSIIENNNGIAFYAGTGNVFRDNIIAGQVVTGTYIIEGGNYYYNNFFNNTVNVNDVTSVAEIWNVTAYSSKNVVGGIYIAGNYWAYPDGIGYSETCSDANLDGICDDPYSIDGFNVDYLPLSNVSSISNDTLTLYYPFYGSVSDNITIRAIVRNSLGNIVNSSIVSIAIDGTTALMSWDSASSSYIVYWIPTSLGTYDFDVTSFDVDGYANSSGTIRILDTYHVCIRLWNNMSMSPEYRYYNEFAWLYFIKTPDQTLGGIFGRDKFACPPEGSPECHWHDKYVNGTACIDLYDAGNYSLYIIGNNIDFKQDIGSGYLADCDFCAPRKVQQRLLLNLGSYIFNADANETLDLYVPTSELYVSGLTFGLSFSWLWPVIFFGIGIIAFMFTMWATRSLKSAIAMLLIMPTILYILLNYALF